MTNPNNSFGGYPLGDVRTTARLNRLLADTDEADRRQRAFNDEQFVRYLRRLWQEEAAAEGANR